MSRERFDEDRIALRFGGQRININPNPNDRLRKAAVPVPGSAEFCLVSGLPLEAFIKHLRSCGVDIEFGPVETTGAEGTIRSVYFRSEEHTSELQSLMRISYAVFCLKKKKPTH